MTTFTETGHAGGFLVSEANGRRSREEITVASGQDLLAGTVLGKVTSTGHYVAYDNDLTNGAQTAAGILWADCDASGGAKQAVAIVRDAEVNEAELVWDEDNGTSDINAGLTDLAALGIIAR